MIDIQRGSLTRLGTATANLSSFSAPEKLCLEIFLEGTDIANAWDCWVYPPASGNKQTAVKWAHTWDKELAETVESGTDVILELREEQIPHATRGCFTPVFWNPIMKRHQESLTMGVLCDPAHPALASFPTESHSNWQWWDVLRPSRVLDLVGMSSRPEPIVRMIDSFIGNRCLSVLFEARLGKSRLLVTSLDLRSDLDVRPAARQLRRSIGEYVNSDRFIPAAAIETEDIDRLIAAHQTEPVRETREEIKAKFDCDP